MRHRVLCASTIEVLRSIIHHCHSARNHVNNDFQMYAQLHGTHNVEGMSGQHAAVAYKGLFHVAGPDSSISLAYSSANTQQDKCPTVSQSQLSSAHNG